MATVTVSESTLVVQIHGLARISSRRSRMEFPIANVAGAALISVRDADNAVVIDLSDDSYARLMLDVSDPAATVAQVASAVQSRGSTRSRAREGGEGARAGVERSRPDLQA